MTEEDEPFSFSELPPFIARDVVEKLHPFDYMRFERTSRLANWYSKTIRNRIPADVGNLYMYPNGLKASCGGSCHIRIFSWEFISEFPYRVRAQQLRIEGHITPEQCKRMTEQLIENQATIEQLMVDVDLEEIDDSVYRIIQHLNPHCITSYRFTPRSLAGVLKNASCIHLRACGLTDSDLLELESTKLVLKTSIITPKGVNHFLKQWLEGDREISGLRIQFDNISPYDHAKEMFEGINVNVIWSIDDHTDSEISTMELDDLFDVRRGDPPKLYSIFKPSDIDDIRIVAVSGSEILVVQSSNEKEFLIKNMLSEQQINLVEH